MSGHWQWLLRDMAGAEMAEKAVVWRPCQHGHARQPYRQPQRELGRWGHCVWGGGGNGEGGGWVSHVKPKVCKSARMREAGRKANAPQQK